ncbi:hypothetical protein PBV52_45690 [Streptomyces sp. T12]|uniref:hypothetical protein n=1 Tax=Streptomyces sp. T12 TaxID=477697 RepID=UPI0023658543|nr:hypothetical protein [Streptomyces sp. T12]WDF43561.1 hypothetical protein PBV52_45690 [Streptomyces sp. T12]
MYVVSPGERGAPEAARAKSGTLSRLLPGGRLPRGAVVSAGGDLPLLIALAAEAAADGGAWAAVGLPQLGGLAAADAGLDLACGLAVPEPGGRWAEVLATVCEAAPVVLLGPVGQVAVRTSRRIAARLRRSGTTLLTWQDWPEAQLRLRVAEARWDGLGDGFGLLAGRRARLVVAGRGAAAQPQHAEVWLPGPDGSVQLIAEPAATAGADVVPLRPVTAG